LQVTRAAIVETNQLTTEGRIAQGFTIWIPKRKAVSMDAKPKRFGISFAVRAKRRQDG
jgi:hypothetical protein